MSFMEELKQVVGDHEVLLDDLIVSAKVRDGGGL